MERHSLTCFELCEREGKMPEAAVEMDEDDCVVVMMENHGWDQVEVNGGQVQIQVTTLCQREESDSVFLVDRLMSAVVPDDDRLQHLKGSLKLDLSHLTPNEAQQLEDLVMESADVIALELGSTKLVSHPIDTSASPPINQPTSRIAFALCQTVEEMVQKMLEQGVVEQSHSPW